MIPLTFWFTKNLMYIQWKFQIPNISATSVIKFDFLILFWLAKENSFISKFSLISNKNDFKKETGLSIKIIWISIDNYFIDSFGFTKPFWAIKRVIQAVYTDKHLCTHEYVPVSCCPRPSQKPPTLVFCTEYHSFKHIMPFNKTFKKLF